MRAELCHDSVAAAVQPLPAEDLRGTRIPRCRLVHLVEDEAVADSDVRARLDSGRLRGRVAGGDRDRVEVVLRRDRVTADPEVVDRPAEALRDSGRNDG